MDFACGNLPTINLKDGNLSNIETYVGNGGRKILLDLPCEVGTAYLFLEGNYASICHEDDEKIIECDTKGLLSGRVIDKMSFIKLEQREDDLPYYVGFALYINEGITKNENLFQMFGILKHAKDRFKLDPITFIKTECAKIAHVFLDDWHVPTKVMLANKGMSFFEVYTTNGSSWGAFEFEESCIADRYPGTGKDFFLADSQGLAKWRLGSTDVEFVEQLPLNVNLEKAFFPKCRTTPQLPNEQVFYTGKSAYFLSDGKSYEIDGATELVGYNFALTDKGLCFIEGWPDDQLKPRLITSKKLKPLLFDCVDSDDYYYRTFFTDEETNDLYVFCGSDVLEVFKITGFDERILDVRVSYQTDEFYVCCLNSTIVVSDFETLPKAQVQFED
jgi:hypothetical protein